MKRAIVTGGCGFIGSYLVKELIDAGYKVVIFDNLSTGKQENIPSSVTFIQGDIRTFEQVLNVIEKDDIVFHLAALTSVPASIEHPHLYHETNILGTIHVMEAVRQKKAKGIIYSSSAAVYGSQEGTMNETLPTHPESPYAFQKAFGEQLGKHYNELYNVPFVALRYFNVYGQGNHEEGSYAPVTARFLKAKREGKPLSIIGTGEQTRDFIHVKDVVHANILAVKLIEKGAFEIINVCSGKATSIIDVAHAVGGEREHHPPRQEIMHSIGTNEKAKSLLGFSPTIELADGIQRLLAQEETSL